MTPARHGGKPGPVKVGPWGGHGGRPRDLNSRLPADHLESITVRSPLIPGSHVSGLSFVYVDRKGQSIPVGPWGSSKAGMVDTISFGEDEFLIEVSGTFDAAGITSLTFVTSSGAEYGPYGFPLGTPFSLSLHHSNSHIIGFFGRSDGVLNALGLYLAPRT
ncbi:hypothetical protein PR202_ga20806 [Eleusine coracana subsp. coracana]|uniref:Jacalin-type lectin domain-containing protein n=1 Tax=Eleusine coracana subsp. coracana TaxID=191504 RepID=A0AAV5CYA4_ELECO|nr:hypothetical protein PR202_ga20806 [Eleusine coracana subsp. coracana]